MPVTRRTAALDPLFKNEKKTGSFDPGNAPPTTPGALLLASMTGWWDARTYIGSGAWVNRGTAGSALNLTISGATFSAGAFTFDGVNDQATCADHSAFDIASGESMCIGWIGQRLSAGADGQRFVDKDSGSGVTWMLRTTTSSGSRYNINDLTQSAQVNGLTIPAAGSDHLFCGVRDVPNALASMYIDGNNGGSPVVLTSTLSVNNSTQFTVGGNNQGGTTGFSNMLVKCVFFNQSALTVAQQQQIAAEYGLTI